jgi:hypothetical protein
MRLPDFDARSRAWVTNLGRGRMQTESGREPLQIPPDQKCYLCIRNKLECTPGVRHEKMVTVLFPGEEDCMARNLCPDRERASIAVVLR